MDTQTSRWLLILSLSLCILCLSSASPVESVKAFSPPEIQLDGADIVLQWPTDPAYIRYNVYRSTSRTSRPTRAPCWPSTAAPATATAAWPAT